MSKIHLVLFLVFSSLVFASDEPDLSPLLKQFPQLKIQQIREIPASGFWELLTEQGEIYYVTDAVDFLFAGELVEVASKDSLTEQRRQALRSDLLRDTPTDILQFKAEKERFEITVATDIDCAYCRRLHQQMADFNNVGISVNYLLMPRAGLSSESGVKARNALCAKRPRVALTAAMAGQALDTANCDHSLARQRDLAVRLGVTGTPTIFLDDGQMIPGYLSPTQLLARFQ